MQTSEKKGIEKYIERLEHLETDLPKVKDSIVRTFIENQITDTQGKIEFMKQKGYYTEYQYQKYKELSLQIEFSHYEHQVDAAAQEMECFCVDEQFIGVQIQKMNERYRKYVENNMDYITSLYL